MRLIALIAALLVTACAAQRPDVNALAESYVRLSLEIGAHEEGYIDAYYGPPEWKGQAEARARTTDEIKADADALLASLADAQAHGADEAAQRRAHALGVYVASARFRLDMIDGTRIAFADEAERLFGLRPRLRALESYDPALADIEMLAPGEGSLALRVQALRDRYIVAPERVAAVMQAAIAECRRRTGAHLALPANEHFDFELVKGQSWGAYNWYKGDNRSLIQVNTDLPFNVGGAIGLGCHEGYPGHHVQGLNAERNYRERGWVEDSVMPLFSPAGPLDEGGGNFGVELAFPGEEKYAFEQSVLFPIAGLDPETAPAYAALREALKKLEGASLTVQQMYLDGQIDRARAVALIQKYGLVSEERAAKSLDFADQYRSYVINYVSGEGLVRAYVDRAGEDVAARWRAYESIYALPTVPADLQ